MKKSFKRFAAAVMTMAMAFSVLGTFASAEEFVTMKKGSKGEMVLEMKQRLFDLGYFSTNQLSDSYTSDTISAVKKFQKANELEATGEVDEATYTLLFSQEVECAFASLETPAELPEIEWPERDEEGYLAGEGEFVYEDDEGGFWAYLTDSLQIMILKRADESIPLEWFETDIRMRNGEGFLTVENNPERPGTKFKYPFDIATENGYVLGFSDDFYGHRIAQKQKLGIVIREGEVICDDTYNKRLHNLPNLDMMAQMPDGSLMTYRCSEITAEELLEIGAVNVFCFGPVLIKDGEMEPIVLEGWYETKSPRQALGMYEPGHYLLLSVQGRMDTSEGTGLIRMAHMLKARGVTEALNLDGGNTMALVFRGRMLNKLATWQNKKFVRTVTSLIGVGQMSYPEADEE